MALLFPATLSDQIDANFDSILSDGGYEQQYPYQLGFPLGTGAMGFDAKHCHE